MGREGRGMGNLGGVEGGGEGTDVGMGDPGAWKEGERVWGRDT